MRDRLSGLIQTCVGCVGAGTSAAGPSGDPDESQGSLGFCLGLGDLSVPPEPRWLGKIQGDRDQEDRMSLGFVQLPAFPWLSSKVTLRSK